MTNLARQVVQIAGLGAGGYALGQSILWVPEGHRGMVVNTMTGESRGPLEEGRMHLRVPFRDVASAIDMRASEREMEVLAPCKDGLKLSVTVMMRFFLFSLLPAQSANSSRVGTYIL